MIDRKNTKNFKRDTYHYELVKIYETHNTKKNANISYCLWIRIQRWVSVGSLNTCTTVVGLLITEKYMCGHRVNMINPEPSY